MEGEKSHKPYWGVRSTVPLTMEELGFWRKLAAESWFEGQHEDRARLGKTRPVTQGQQQGFYSRGDRTGQPISSCLKDNSGKRADRG